MSLIFVTGPILTRHGPSTFCTFHIRFYSSQTDNYAATLISENGIVLDSNYAVLFCHQLSNLNCASGIRWLVISSKQRQLWWTFSLTNIDVELHVGHVQSTLGERFNVKRLINKSLHTCSTNCRCLYCCLVTRMLRTYLYRIVKVTCNLWSYQVN